MYYVQISTFLSIYQEPSQFVEYLSSLDNINNNNNYIQNLFMSLANSVIPTEPE